MQIPAKETQYIIRLWVDCASFRWKCLIIDPGKFKDDIYGGGDG